MKKIVFIFLLLFVTGCSSVEGEEVNCVVDGKKAVFWLNDGIVVKYTLNGKDNSQSTIDEINGIYFTSATNNDEGKEALTNYIQSVNGSCDL